MRRIYLFNKLFQRLCAILTPTEILCIVLFSAVGTDLSYHIMYFVYVYANSFLYSYSITFCGHMYIQTNFSGSNTDGSFTTAVSNSFLSP